MAGDKHDAETQEEPQAQKDLGRQEAQMQVEGAGAATPDYEKQIAKRDEKIASLEA